MPDEREMEEIRDAMKPLESTPLPRAERRRIARDQSSQADRFTGIKRCDWCYYELELEREPLPEHCPGCGEPYSDPPTIQLTTMPGGSPMPTDAIDLDRAVARRHASGLESLASVIGDGVEAFKDFTDLVRDIAEALAQRVGKVGR